MEKEILEIIKQKDDFAFVVEISETAKGEPKISVKVRSDVNVTEASEQALKEYRRLKEELKK